MLIIDYIVTSNNINISICKHLYILNLSRFTVKHCDGTPNRSRVAGYSDKIKHHNDFNINTHIFLCIIWMIFYRYLAWKCKYPGLSLRRLEEEMEEMEGIRVALMLGKTGGKVDLVVDEMDAKQVRLFSLLDLGEIMGRGYPLMGN